MGALTTLQSVPTLAFHHPALQIILSRITHQIRPKHNAVWMAVCPDEERSGLFRARISCSGHPRGLPAMLGTNFMLDLIPFLPRTTELSSCSYSFDFAVNTLFHSVLISSSAFLSSHEQALAIWLIVSPVTYDHFSHDKPTLIVQLFRSAAFIYCNTSLHNDA